MSFRSSQWWAFWEVIILQNICSNIRNSQRRYSVRKGVLRNVAKFTGKHLCQSLCLRPATLLKKVFSCEFCENYKNTFFVEYLRVTASIDRSVQARHYYVMFVCRHYERMNLPITSEQGSRQNGDIVCSCRLLY